MNDLFNLALSILTKEQMEEALETATPQQRSKLKHLLFGFGHGLTATKMREYATKPPATVAKLASMHERIQEVVETPRDKEYTDPIPTPAVVQRAKDLLFTLFMEDSELEPASIFSNEVAPGLSLEWYFDGYSAIILVVESDIIITRVNVKSKPLHLERLAYTQQSPAEIITFLRGTPIDG